ncbi:MAG: hypothetical protein CM1200mP28_00800 [Deltaproteobacteria bacterium]|nr:MAG: hypothetical protein CM1200mP28_00800 [Deltaproteobacteria bacterium]
MRTGKVRQYLASTEALGLKSSSVKGIVFHEITESAIINALENPRDVDQKLVNAQQARRILDRR